MRFDLSVSQPAANHSVQRFETDRGASIFQLPVEAFPGFWAYAYLVLVDGYKVLVDTGSGFGASNQHLEARLREASEQFGVSLAFSNLTHVLITHGHIDHFGGLPHVRANSVAKVGVHELDLRILTNAEERLTIVAHRLAIFLAEAGISTPRRRELLQLYKMIKLDYTPVPVDFTYEAVDMRVGPFEMLHVPGHCAGQVVIRLHDVLFSGDHVLSDISPHQAPERLVLNTGLGHYLASLESLRGWAEGIRLTLGGHNAPIVDLPSRIDAIRDTHVRRLQEVLDLLAEPHTIAEISQSLFGEVHGYNVLLALEETGAHIEYLCQRGLIGIANLADLKNDDEPVPIRYYRLET
ncbi:MAG: MBL fold metallo-hydrolase [Chloroflexi bacterium]|nr:MBL fold metallo-hydrolase [Chloroflexota bacterium]